MVDGETAVIKAGGELAGRQLVGPDDPYLYDVYTILTVDGKVVDVNKISTGFRKTEFKGGAGTGGVYINDRFVYLKGYAQRSVDEWAGRRRGVSRLDARFHTRPAPRRQRQLHPLDAHRPQARRRAGLRPVRHRRSLPGRRQGKGRPTAGNGSSAWKSCATRSSITATTPAFCSGRPATTASAADAHAADGRSAQGTGPQRRPRHGLPRR